MALGVPSAGFDSRQFPGGCIALLSGRMAGRGFGAPTNRRQGGMNTRGDTRGYEVLLAAFEQLRLRLLDLTGRNRLLNFRHSAGRSLQFVEGQPGAIYEKLVEGNTRASIAIAGLPEPSRRDWVERNGRLFRPEPLAWASQQGIPTSYDIDEGGTDAAGIRALLYLDDLAKHCRKIEREGRAGDRRNRRQHALPRAGIP